MPVLTMTKTQLLRQIDPDFMIICNPGELSTDQLFLLLTHQEAYKSMTKGQGHPTPQVIVKITPLLFFHDKSIEP